MINASSGGGNQIPAPASSTKDPIAAPPPPNPPDGNKAPDAALELYKLEYERCVMRYQELYQAVWTNFSYMAIIAGAILTFGGDRFDLAVLALLACAPLVFWYLATFEPLNKYGDQVLERLTWIERILNEEYHLTKETLERDLDRHKGLRHFTEFKESREKPTNSTLTKEPSEEKPIDSTPTKEPWYMKLFSFLLIHRVRSVVRVGFVLLLIATIWLGLRAFGLLGVGEPTEVKQIAINLKGEVAEIKISGIELKELEKLLNPREIRVVVIDSQGKSKEVRWITRQAQESIAPSATAPGGGETSPSKNQKQEGRTK
jgi:hypothetical protein